MNSIVVLILGLIVFFVGYRVYAKYIDTKVMKSDPKKATPAKMYMDGVEFMPTSKSILFGYQFKSIAGAAPIIGPIIAIQWGWLPALIWILGGALFIGLLFWLGGTRYSTAIMGLIGAVIGAAAAGLGCGAAGPAASNTRRAARLAARVITAVSPDAGSWPVQPAPRRRAPRCRRARRCGATAPPASGRPGRTGLARTLPAA